MNSKITCIVSVSTEHHVLDDLPSQEDEMIHRYFASIHSSIWLLWCKTIYILSLAVQISLIISHAPVFHCYFLL